MENIAIAQPDFTINVTPSFREPIRRNGMFRTMVRILNGIWVRLFTMMPIPMTPPSKIVQGTRNSSMANAAMADPTVNIRKSKNSRIFGFNSLIQIPPFLIQLFCYFPFSLMIITISQPGKCPHSSYLVKRIFAIRFATCS